MMARNRTGVLTKSSSGKWTAMAGDENHATLTKAMLRKAGVEVVSITEPVNRRQIRARSIEDPPGHP